MDLIEKYLGESMSRSKAYKMDLEYAKKTKKNPFYSDGYVDEPGEFVFGKASGFEYAENISDVEAKKQVKKMWKEMKQKLKK